MVVLCKKSFYVLELIQRNGDGWADTERVHTKEESRCHSKVWWSPTGVELEQKDRPLLAVCFRAGNRTGAFVIGEENESENQLPESCLLWPLGFPGQEHCSASVADTRGLEEGGWLDPLWGLMESTESGGRWEDKKSATGLGMRLLVTDFKATCSCLRGIWRESLHSFQEYIISSLTLAFSVSDCSPPFILRWECTSVTFTASSSWMLAS